MRVTPRGGTERSGAGGRLLLAGLAGLLIAGIVHLAAILALARDDRTDAFARLAASGQDVRLQTIAGPLGADKAFPFRDPAMADAFCLFDLRGGAVEVSLAVTPLDVSVLSVHDRHGQAVYALTNRSAVRGILALTVMTPQMVAAQETDDAGDTGLRVALDGPEGFIMAEALAATPSQRPAAEALVHGLSCRIAPVR